MSLRARLGLGGSGPVDCRLLAPLKGQEFDLPTPDPRLRMLHEGGPAPTPPLENLVGARNAWESWPEGMDFLNPESPVFEQKRLERDLYWRRWAPRLRKAGRVLDLGGGIGRFSSLLLDLGWEVELVDPDLRSLQRAVWHAAGKPGKLAVHWTSGELLPPMAPVEAVIAAEVLCYVENPSLALQNVRNVLRPGAPLFFSVEARWGWGLTMDAAAGSLKSWLTDGIVRVTNDRWVRTFDQPGLRELFAGWELKELLPTHYVSSGPFETAGGAMTVEEMEEMEDRLRSHPIAANLHRAWTGVAV